MKRLLTYFQTEFGLAKSESVVVASILGILLLGYVGRFVVPSTATHDVVSTQRVIELLDSMQSAFASDSTAARPGQLDNRVSANSSHVYQPIKREGTKAPAQGIAARINLNTATRNTLMRLPGIGPAMADRIIEERKTRPFSTVDDLTRVKGIGAKKLEKIRPFATVP